MGGKHVDAPVDGAVVCQQNKIASTPAYMLGPTISKVALGIEKMVKEVLRLAG
jgi:enhancing lycopene biosynthesis protein 2